MTKGIICMPILTVVLAFLGGELILRGVISEQQGRGAALIITFTVSCVCSCITGKRCAKMRMVWCLGTAVVYGCMLMIGNLLFFGVSFRHLGMSWLAVICGGIVAVFASVKKNGKYA